MKLEKPLLLYDGECRFCCRWIERWKAITGDRVDYETSQSAGPRFPEIPPEEFGRAVQLLLPDGVRLSGAEAVLAALATSSRFGQEGLDLYRFQGIFARLADGTYGLIARNRTVFSRLTVLLWGPDVRRPSYAISSRLFLHLLGLVYLVAFWSYWVQLPGLIGGQGILPATKYFQAAHQALGSEAYWQFPSFCWLSGAGEPALQAWCVAGLIAALFLLLGFAPGPCLLFLWADYLSLVVAGQDFYGFQWDALLLEASFMALFLVPWTWRLRTTRPPSWSAFLLLWLLFRLMFASGVVKLSSGDPSWWQSTALQYHYYTQPLPTALAWYAQQLPVWWQAWSVRGVFLVELILPFFLFFPRRLRLLGVGGIAFLQILIAATGNYGFFNLLTLVLCLMAVDDSVWPRWLARRIDSTPRRYLPTIILGWSTAVLVFLSFIPLLSSFRTRLLLPVDIYEIVAPFRSLNSYGLFAVMTTERKEIQIQHSEDGLAWTPYAFPYKPGNLRQSPRWMAPYMPRLDWMMWFAALSDAQSTPWFQSFLARLLQGSHPVENLLAAPIPEKPPRYIRALAEDYTFTTPAERARTGDWWKAEPAGEYFPKVELKQTP